MSLRETCLAANDRENQPIVIPEWGSPKLFVKVWDGAERDGYDTWARSRKGNFLGVRARVVRLGIVDESGAYVFTDEDEAALQGKSAVVLNRIFDAVFKLNKLGGEELDDAKKNSATTPNAGSGSG